MKWELLLNVARKLKEIGDNIKNDNIVESYYRSSINRAYYACYNICADIARSYGKEIPQTGKGHSEVKNWLKKHFDKNIELLNSLESLAYKRKLADYDKELPPEYYKNPIVWTEDGLITAEALINKLNEIDG